MKYLITQTKGEKNLRIEKTNRDSKKLVLLQHKSNTHISIPWPKNQKKKTPVDLSSHEIFPTYAFFFHHLLYIPSLESFIDNYHTWKQGERPEKINK